MRAKDLEKRNSFQDLLWMQGEERAVPSTAFADVRNFVYTPYGKLKLRRGFKKLNTTTLGGPVMGLAQVPWTVSATKLVCAVGNSIYLWDPEILGFVAITQAQTSGHPTSFAAYGGHLLFANGVDELKVWNGSVVMPVVEPEGGWYANQNPSFVIIHKDRAWAVVGPMIYASDLQVPWDFKGGSATQFPSRDDNPIKCLVDAFDRLFVVKDRSIAFVSEDEHGWLVGRAYASVDGTPSPFGACGFGEAVYYVSPNGAFEVVATGRETIGNFNTKPLHKLGIAPLFDMADQRHIHFNSLEKAIVVPHFGRNEAWFFVRDSSGAGHNTILVYCRDLERWTRFTAPNVTCACEYINGANQRIVAVGTQDGFVGFSDQATDGKDMGTDFVAHSYIDFVWSGKDPAEFHKAFRAFLPVVKCAEFRFSTWFDQARTGVSNVPVSVGLDAVAHEVPIEVGGRGVHCRTRIAGKAGEWPLEIEAVGMVSRPVRQKRLSGIAPMGAWALVDPTDFTRRQFPLASWTRASQMNWVYSGNKHTALQGAAVGNVFMVSSNQVAITWPVEGAGRVAMIRGAWLKSTQFDWEGYWADPEATAVDYYAGGTFTNYPEQALTVVDLGTPLGDGTELEVRYIYWTDESIEAYAALNNYPCILPAGRGAEFTYDWASDMLLEMAGLFWMRWKKRPGDEATCKAALDFLWEEFVATQESKDPYPALDKFDWNIRTGRKLVIFKNINSPDKARITLETKVLEAIERNGLWVRMDFLEDQGEAWFGYGLGWGPSVFSRIQGLSFLLTNLTNNAAMAVRINNALPDEPDPYTAPHQYIAGICGPVTEPEARLLPLNQFWRKETTVWDGVRMMPDTGSYYSASQPVQIYPNVSYEAQEIVSPEGDHLHAGIKYSFTNSPYITAIGVWFGRSSETASSAGFAGVCCLGWVDPTLTGMTLRLKVTGHDDVERYADVSVNGTGWKRFSALWAEFSGAIVHPIKTVTIESRTPPDVTHRFTDVCWCDGSKVPVRYRITDSGISKFIRLFEFVGKYVAGPSYWTGTTPNQVEIGLTDIGFRLLEPDKYPLAPHFATSVTEMGLHNWRGPTMVHYSRPLVPWICRDKPMADVSLASSKKIVLDATARYKALHNIDGLVMPAHSRNLPENLSTMEFLNQFEWWRKWRTYGLEQGAWNFNNHLKDSSGWGRTLSWSSGSPTYAPGICIPVTNTAISFTGTAYAHYGTTNFNSAKGSFSVSIVLKCTTQSGDNKVIAQRMGATNGWTVRTKLTSQTSIQLVVKTSAGTYYADAGGVIDDNWHSVHWSVNAYTNTIRVYKDGVFDKEISWAVGNGISNSEPLQVGFDFVGLIDLLKFDHRALLNGEMEEFHKMLLGEENGSGYPELGYHFAQYLPFRNLAMYRWASGDTSVDAYLADMVTWINTYTKDLGGGKYQPPRWFHPYGFTYGTDAESLNDPSGVGILLQGLVYHYWVTGDATALTWINRWLDDLRLNRLDPVTNTFKTDFAYSWMYAHAMSGFGLAIYEREGATINHHISVSSDNIAFWQSRMTWLLSQVGDTKPNQLTPDLIPYTYHEAQDSFEYAPHYMFERNMGSTEALVLIANLAFDRAQQTGDWQWFMTLLNFLVRVTL